MGESNQGNQGNKENGPVCQYYSARADNDWLIEQFESMLGSPAVNSVMVLGCADNNLEYEALHAYLKEFPLPVFGGIFPGILREDCVCEQGLLLLGLPFMTEVRTITEISNPLTSFDERVELFDDTIDPVETMLIFVDGFSRRIDDFIVSLFNVYGLERNYIGGGAGSLENDGEPCLLSNEGFLKDAAVLAYIPVASSLGVRHGWEAVAGPFKATEADHTEIKSLDWTHAYDVYKKQVSEQGSELDERNFPEVAKFFPLGIGKIEAEMVVRDPFKVTQNGGLVCVGEIPQGSYLYLLQGDKNSLIQAAAEARQEAVEEFDTESRQNPVMLCMDCISRYLFLQESFSEELATMRQEGIPLFGALTIGEIANNGKSYLEFYNKTSVVGLLEMQ